MDLFEYTGHLHIHSTFSDGEGDIPRIVRAAGAAGLDFVGITDHNTLAAREQGLEGWHGRVLVLVGMEINNNKNHYIAFGVHKPVSPDDQNPANVIAAVAAQGGFGYPAHPVEKPNPAFMNGRCYPWDSWETDGYSGLEIWNFGSRWREAYRRRWQALFWYYVDPYRAVRFPDPEGLALWDRLNQQRPVFAFVGSDAHAATARAGPLRLTLFPYRFLFKTFNVHILLPALLGKTFPAARDQVLGALRTGSFFCCSDYLHPGRGFCFSAESAGGELTGMGSNVVFTPGLALHLNSPAARGLIRIMENGRLVWQGRQRTLTFKVPGPGVFRAEVYRPTRWGNALPWIYSNPIYVIPPGQKPRNEM